MPWETLPKRFSKACCAKFVVPMWMATSRAIPVNVKIVKTKNDPLPRVTEQKQLAFILTWLSGGDKEDVMDRQSIISKLLALPAKIAAEEDNVLQAHANLIEAKGILQQKEDSLLLGNIIDGKNAEIRAAQMREYTEDERKHLIEAELNLKNAVARLERYRDEFRALRSVAELLKGVA
ncbi:hypothetical protein QJ48_04345 [Paenibacillus sp. A3]|nr:hypothetical protein QJ48_04345 [Paenibacillus sp. A3]